MSLTHLSEQKGEQNDSQGFIKELLDDHQSTIIVLRERIKSLTSDFHDLGSSDFATGLMEMHEKMAWFLRSHLKNKEK